MTKMTIELTSDDFYDMIANLCWDDMDWDRMNKEERIQFKKTLMEGIDKVLNTKGFQRSMKQYLIDHYEDSDFRDDDFCNAMNKAVKEANKRLDKESDEDREKEEEEEERKMYNKLHKKFGGKK